MRTTLILDDELLISAKTLAAEKGTSLSSVVSEALRVMMSQNPSVRPEETFRLPIFDGEGEINDAKPTTIRELMEDDTLNGFE